MTLPVKIVGWILIIIYMLALAGTIIDDERVPGGRLFGVAVVSLAIFYIGWTLSYF